MVPTPIPPSPSSSSSSSSKRKHDAAVSAGARDDRVAPLILRPGSVATRRTACIVGFSEGCSRYFSGSFYVTLLKGSASINGFDLPVGVRLSKPCHFPLWQPGALLQVSVALPSPPSSSKKRRDKDKSKNKDKGKSTALSALLTPLLSSWSHDVDVEPYATMLLIEGIPLHEQEWLVAAEDQRPYCESDDGDGTKYVRVESGLLGTAEALSTLGIDHTSFAPDWRAASQQVLDALPTMSPRAIVCGAKGVGKSTCLRLALNRLLGQRQQGGICRPVCVLDWDLGQPEFTVPGMVSLHLVTEPTLAPMHLNLRRPLLSFFLGDVTSKHDPDAMVRAVGLLMERYRQELATHLQRREAERSRQRQGEALDAAALPANSFELLGTDFDEDDDGDNSNSGADAAADALPLLINADGFVRFMGEEVLAAVVGLVAPTHILHISTEKDKRLAAVERARSQSATPDGLPVSVISLSPGRLAASRVAPADLRTLRLAAYFLRDSRLLAEAARVQGGGAPDLAAFSGGTAVSSSGGVQVRTAALGDKSGALAFATMRAPAFAVPLRSVYLQTLHAGLAPRLVLAALNASIVAITASPAGPPEHSSVALTAERGEPLSVNVCSSHSLMQRPDDLAPCVGLAIVRAIDPTNETIYLTTPVNPAEAFPPGHALRLVRGNMSLPNAFVYAPNLPCYPYLSGECTGEGGALMKARTNVKRRSHQKGE